jgi:hypothetical protein
MSEQTEWAQIKDLRVDDVVRLRQGGGYRYYAVDTKPEPTGEHTETPFRKDIPLVEFWVTEQTPEMDSIGESYPETRSGLANVQVLIPRPKI